MQHRDNMAIGCHTDTKVLQDKGNWIKAIIQFQSDSPRSILCKTQEIIALIFIALIIA